MLLEETSIIANASLSNTDSEIEGPSKSKRLCPLQSTVLLDVFSEIVADSNETNNDHSVNVGEVDRYLNVPIIDCKTGDPYLWWSPHHQEFPFFSKLARRYLSAPATSVLSEQLFTVAGDLHDEKRNRIMPELSQDLLFIQNNFNLVGTKYNF